MEDKYPELEDAKDRENAICTRTRLCLLVIQIGDVLKSGKRDVGRAPDYDDLEIKWWHLIRYEPLQCALELSVYGIRVDEDFYGGTVEEDTGDEDRLKSQYV